MCRPSFQRTDSACVSVGFYPSFFPRLGLSLVEKKPLIIYITATMKMIKSTTDCSGSKTAIRKQYSRKPPQSSTASDLYLNVSVDTPGKNRKINPSIICPSNSPISMRNDVLICPYATLMRMGLCPRSTLVLYMARIVRLTAIPVVGRSGMISIFAFVKWMTMAH